MLAKILPFLMLTPLLLDAGCKKAEPAPAASPKPAAKAPIIAPVYFETGSTEIKDSELDAIDRAAQVLKSSDWTCLVLGLADATGDAAQNKELSENRAEAVAAKLRTKAGVGSNRIITFAIGERLASGGSHVTERKVEFVFYHDEGLPLREVVTKSRVLEEDFRNAR